jgi:hypothetical protein
MKCSAQTLATLTLVLSACSGGQNSPQGPTQAFRIRNAQFVPGSLPGVEPPDGGTAVGDAGADAPPSITSIESYGRVAFQGQANKKLAGRASLNAFAVALAMPDASEGYWVLPVGAPDPSFNELTWSAVADVGVQIEPGNHEVRVAAIDESGRAGTQLSSPLCVTGRVPDGLHACDPSLPVPQAVISLHWDVNADLDLRVVTPDGTVVDSKHRTTTPEDDAGAVSAGTGSIDRDSNAGCVIDAIRYENLVWDSVMPEGRYGIYVNLFDACKQPAARFVVEVYSAVSDAEGRQKLERYFQRGGELLDLNANAGTSPGLFVTEFDFR